MARGMNERSMAGFEELTMRLAGRPEYKKSSSSSRFEFEAARCQQQIVTLLLATTARCYLPDQI